MAVMSKTQSKESGLWFVLFVVFVFPGLLVGMLGVATIVRTGLAFAGLPPSRRCTA